jgi:hypothetical protein
VVIRDWSPASERETAPYEAIVAMATINERAIRRAMTQGLEEDRVDLEERGYRRASADEPCVVGRQGGGPALEPGGIARI